MAEIGLIWIITAILSVKRCWANDCPFDLDDCLNSVGAESLKGLLAPSPEDLKKACSTFKEGMKCVHQYTNSCLTEDRKIELEQTVAGANQAMTSVCTDRTTNSRTNYHKCYEQLSKEIAVCSVAFQELRQRRPLHKPEDTVRDICCANADFDSCVKTKSAQLCEKKAALQAMEVIRSATNTHLQYSCQQMNISECISGASTNHQFFLTFLFVTFVLRHRQLSAG